MIKHASKGFHRDKKLGKCISGKQVRYIKFTINGTGSAKTNKSTPWTKYAIFAKDFTLLQQEFREFRRYEWDRKMKHGYELVDLMDRVTTLEEKLFWKFW